MLLRVLPHRTSLRTGFLRRNVTQIISEAAGALWALSFDEENRKEMVENKKLRVIQRLSELKASDINKIKTAATGALWNLREDLRMSDDPTYQTLGEETLIMY